MHKWRMTNINTFGVFYFHNQKRKSFTWSAFLFYMSYAGGQRWERKGPRRNRFRSESELWVVKLEEGLRDDLIQCTTFTNEHNKAQGDSL